MARTSSLLRRVGYAVGEQDADRERSLELFEALIREARQDEKGRGRIGAMFLDEAARTIHLLVAAYRLDPPVTHDLARVFARAGVKAPPALVQCLIGQMDELIQAGGLPFDPNAEIERLSVVLELDEHYLHRKLDERIGVLPEELRAAFADEVACREEAACGRIAMYWLLDASAEVRLGAAEGFREQAHREIVEPVSAALVPLVRNWMPQDTAHIGRALHGSGGCGAGCCQQANGAGAASFSAARVYSRRSRCQVRGGTAGEPAATELVPPARCGTPPTTNPAASPPPHSHAK